jgi:DNA-binding transcriptional LysR family regulator
MDRFLAIEAFVRVAESQSFAKAARSMRVSKSVVTTRVQQLEELVGAALFHRNTRNVRLSEVGAAYLAECTHLVGRADELVDQMRGLQSKPTGRLRVHALPGFVLGHLAAHLRAFQEQYPEITLDLVVNDAAVDPVREGFDCALQIFRPVSDELVSRPVFPVRRVFCASPSYLRRHGVPKHPRDLFGHRLGLYSGYPTRDRWVFHQGAEKVVLDLKPALLSNSVHLLAEYAQEQAGIVCIPTLVAAGPVLDGRLKMVLPTWQLSSFQLCVVYPQSHRSGVKLRLFIDSLVSQFAGEPPWDRGLIDKGLLRPALIEGGRE